MRSKVDSLTRRLEQMVPKCSECHTRFHVTHSDQDEGQSVYDGPELCSKCGRPIDVLHWHIEIVESGDAGRVQEQRQQAQCQLSA